MLVRRLMISKCGWGGFGLLSVALVAGCAQGSGADAGRDNTGAEVGQAAEVSAVEGRAHARLSVPAGWATRVVGSSWAVHTSPDGVSRVAMGAVEPFDDIVEKLREAGAAMGATQVKTAAEQDTRFGSERLPARAADGACKLGAIDGRIGYAVIDLGGGKRVMVVHAAPSDTADEALVEGRRMVASLERS